MHLNVRFHNIFPDNNRNEWVNTFLLRLTSLKV